MVIVFLVRAMWTSVRPGNYCVCSPFSLAGSVLFVSSVLSGKWAAKKTSPVRLHRSLTCCVVVEVYQASSRTYFFLARLVGSPTLTSYSRGECKSTWRYIRNLETFLFPSLLSVCIWRMANLSPYTKRRMRLTVSKGVRNCIPSTASTTFVGDLSYVQSTFFRVKKSDYTRKGKTRIISGRDIVEFVGVGVQFAGRDKNTDGKEV